MIHGLTDYLLLLTRHGCHSIYETQRRSSFARFSPRVFGSGVLRTQFRSPLYSAQWDVRHPRLTLPVVYGGSGVFAGAPTPWLRGHVSALL